MSISFTCPFCQKTIKAPESRAGESVKCPYRTCGKLVAVPPLTTGNTPKIARSNLSDFPDSAVGPITTIRQFFGFLLVRGVLSALAVGLCWYFFVFIPAGRGNVRKEFDYGAYRQEVGLNLVEAAVMSDGRFSHLLLPDSRYTVFAFDQKRHASDLASISKLFPDAEQRKQVLKWGRELFEACRMRYRFRYLKNKDYYDTNPAGLKERKPFETIFALPVNDGLAAHAAWQRLTCAPGVKAADLFNLQEGFQAAVPQESERAHLLQWAAFRRNQRYHERVFQLGKEEIRSVVRPLVPNTPWFLLWILFEDWTFTSEGFAAKKNDFLTCVGADASNRDAKWRAVLELGQSYTDQRRQSGEKTLPPFSEKTALLAVMDRLSNLDPAVSPRVDKANEKYLNLVVAGDGVRMAAENSDGGATMWLDYLFNAEDVITVADSTLANTQLTPYRLADVPSPQREEIITTPKHLPRQFSLINQIMAAILICLPFSWIALSAVRFATTDIPGLALFLFVNERFRRWVGGFDVYGFGQVILWYVLAWIGIWLAPWTPGQDPLKTLLTSNVHSNLIPNLFLITFGAILTEGVNNVVVVLFFRLGMNPFGASGWIVNVCSSVASACVQLFFGIPLMAILIGTAIGNIAPSLLLQLLNASMSNARSSNTQESTSHPSRFGSCGCSVLTVILFLGLVMLDRLHASRYQTASAQQNAKKGNEPQLTIRPTPQQPYWWRMDRP